MTHSVEKLEAVEQQITLTLQEIDCDFVNIREAASRILQQSRRYVQNTQDLHQTLQVWKNFFHVFEKEKQHQEKFLLLQRHEQQQKLEKQEQEQEQGRASIQKLDEDQKIEGEGYTPNDFESVKENIEVRENINSEVYNFTEMENNLLDNTPVKRSTHVTEPRLEESSSIISTPLLPSPPRTTKYLINDTNYEKGFARDFSSTPTYYKGDSPPRLTLQLNIDHNNNEENDFDERNRESNNPNNSNINYNDNDISGFGYDGNNGNQDTSFFREVNSSSPKTCMMAPYYAEEEVLNNTLTNNECDYSATEDATAIVTVPVLVDNDPQDSEDVANSSFQFYASDDDEEINAPKEFELSLFPSAFQNGVGAEQLIKLYNVLASDTDIPKSINELNQKLPGFGEERIELFLGLLTSRKFVVKKKNLYVLKIAN